MNACSFTDLYFAHIYVLYSICVYFAEFSLTVQLFLLYRRACPSEFVIPLATYQKAIYGTQLSVGMRFGMMFETEESGKRR